jgi:hypothetical protein
MQLKKDQIKMAVKNSYRYLHQNPSIASLASEEIKPARFSSISRLECSVPLHLLKIQDLSIILVGYLMICIRGVRQPSDDCAVCLVKERCRFRRKHGVLPTRDLVKLHLWTHISNSETSPRRYIVLFTCCLPIDSTQCRPPCR